MKPGANYLIRLDDLCPTMNWAFWEKIETTLERCSIVPILAVVPNNMDPELRVDAPFADFWEKVRGWQARGWTIALHGYQHRYVNKEPGILRLGRQSEFAGLSRAEQEGKLRCGLAIFAREGIRADAWVAPSHSFDWTTVEVLSELGIRVISDGLAFAPYSDRFNTIWVPQQFAGIRPMPWGVWTFCYHQNAMTGKDVSAFICGLERLQRRFITLGEAAAMGANRKRSLADRCLGGARLWLLRAQRAVKHL